MNILGLDPGLKETGYGIIDNERKVIEFGVIKGKNPFEQAKKFEKILLNHKPDFAFIEDAFFHKNPKMSLKLGEVRGVFIYILESKGVKVFNIPTSKVKKALTGNGRASKKQVYFMVSHFLSFNLPDSTHIADALACALAGLFSNVFKD